MKYYTRTYVAVFALIIGLVTVSHAQTSPGNFPAVTVKNFGQMDTNYFRGGQPKKDEYKALADLGINTIVDLRNDPTDYEKPVAESLGMKYINIPMDDAEYPSEKAIAAFLQTINDPANGKMFVHCKGGKHRAGITGAVYRYTKYGWDYDKVMTEMKNYKFNTTWGRKVMKTFVEDYGAKMKLQESSAVSAQGN